MGLCCKLSYQKLFEQMVCSFIKLLLNILLTPYVFYICLNSDLPIRKLYSFRICVYSDGKFVNSPNVI